MKYGFGSLILHRQGYLGFSLSVSHFIGICLKRCSLVVLWLLKFKCNECTVPLCRQYSRHKTTFYLVFDFCEHDLAGLLSNINVKFSLGWYRNLLTFFSYKPSYLLGTGTVPYGSVQLTVWEFMQDFCLSRRLMGVGGTDSYLLTYVRY
jgi:hypothetical protein